MHFMTTIGIILLVAYVAFMVGSLGYTIGFFTEAPQNIANIMNFSLWKQWIKKSMKSKRTA